jgi:hypothetical protein
MEMPGSAVGVSSRRVNADSESFDSDEFSDEMTGG